MSDTMNDTQGWQPCKYENKCVSPPIFGECYLLKIGDADRWIHAGVYPVHGGWDLHVQEVVMRGRTECHTLLHSAVAATDAEARTIAETLARVAYVGAT